MAAAKQEKGGGKSFIISSSEPRYMATAGGDEEATFVVVVTAVSSSPRRRRRRHHDILVNHSHCRLLTSCCCRNETEPLARRIAAPPQDGHDFFASMNGSIYSRRGAAVKRLGDCCRSGGCTSRSGQLTSSSSGKRQASCSVCCAPLYARGGGAGPPTLARLFEHRLLSTCADSTVVALSQRTSHWDLVRGNSIARLRDGRRHDVQLCQVHEHIKHLWKEGEECISVARHGQRAHQCHRRTSSFRFTPLRRTSSRRSALTSAGERASVSELRCNGIFVSTNGLSQNAPGSSSRGGCSISL